MSRRARFGLNALPEAPREALSRRLLRQFQSPLLYVLLFALAVDLTVWVSEGGEIFPFEALAIAVILLPERGTRSLAGAAGRRARSRS